MKSIVKRLGKKRSGEYVKGIVVKVLLALSWMAESDGGELVGRNRRFLGDLSLLGKDLGTLDCSFLFIYRHM